MRIRMWILVLTLIFGFCIYAYTQAAELQYKNLLDRLLLESIDARVEAQRELVRLAMENTDLRQRLIPELIAIVESEENRHKKSHSVELAMMMLGQLGAKEVVDVLVDNITFPVILPTRPGPQMLSIRFIVPFSEIPSAYRSVQALIDIGKPSLNSVLDKLRTLPANLTDQNRLEQVCCLAVIRHVEGRELGKVFLEQAIQREIDSRARVNLERALGVFQKFFSYPDEERDVKSKSAEVAILPQGQPLLPTQSSTSFAPLRDIAESLGAKVNWIADSKTVIVSLPNKTIRVEIGSPYALANGEQVLLDRPAQVVNGRAIMPMNFIEEAFEVNIKWDEKSKTACVTTKKPM